MLVLVLVPGASACASACARTRLVVGASAGARARSRLAGGGFGLVGGRASTAFYTRVGVWVFFGQGQQPLMLNFIRKILKCPFISI